MELRFNEAEIAFRQEVRDFIAKELPKETHERMVSGKSPTKTDGHGLAAQAERQGLGRAGMADGMGRPGLDAGQRYIFREELQQAPAPQPLAFNTNMCGPVITEFGTRGAEEAVPAAHAPTSMTGGARASPSPAPARTSPASRPAR